VECGGQPGHPPARGTKEDGKFLVASIDPMTVKLKEPTTSLETLIDLTKEGDPGAS
jgi:hypothetical protein